MAIGWREQYSRYKGFFLNIFDLYKKRSELRMFLDVILSLVTIIIFTLFALKPTILTIISLVKQINEKEAVVVLLDKKIADLQKARVLYQQSQEEIQLIKNAIPDVPSPDIAVRQIEGLANRNSVQILGVSVGETVLLGNDKAKRSSSDFTALPANAREMSISISVTGTYQNLNSLAKDIENLRIPVKIDTLGVNSSDSETGRTIVTIISGRIPYTRNEN